MHKNLRLLPRIFDHGLATLVIECFISFYPELLDPATSQETGAFHQAAETRHS